MSVENRRVRLATTLAALLLFAGCSGQDTGPADNGAETPAAGGGAAAACVAAVQYDGHLYVQVQAPTPERGQELGGAEIPGCNDTGGTDAPAEPVVAFAIAGVDTEYAVTVGEGESAMVYVRDDYALGIAGAKPLPTKVSAKLGLSSG